MFKRRIKLTLIALSILLGLLILMIGSEVLYRFQMKNEKLAVPQERTEIYRNQGLEPGIILDSSPNSYADNKVFFDDRILDNRQICDSELNQRADAMKLFLNAAKRYNHDLNLYSVFVPGRIAFETPFSSDPDFLQTVSRQKEYYQSVENLLSQNLGENFIPLLSVLEPHEQEYIYFRTDPAWTARGAYYGSQEILKAADLEVFPMEQFYEFNQCSTFGRYKIIQDIPSDRLYFFLYQNYNPMVEKVGKNAYAPMISKIRSGTESFLGENNQIYYMDALAENDRVLLVMGRANAKVLTPWFTGSFSKILFIDMNEFYNKNLDFWTLLDNYQVTDLLIVEDIDSLESFYQTLTYRDTALLMPRKD